MLADHSSPLPYRTTVQVATAQRRLTRWLHAQFARKLSLEDCADVAADAMWELHGVTQQQRVLHPETLLRRIGRHRALDAIRAREGEGKDGPRKPFVPIEPDDTVLADPQRPFAAVDAAQATVQAYEDLGRAIDALAEDERTLVTLRHVDGLPAGTVAGLLGLSRPQYERLHTRAMKQLRTALLDETRDASCGQTRRMIDRAPLPLLDALRRDAHLAGCLGCSAYARARSEPAFEGPQPRGTTQSAAPDAA